MNKIYLLLVLLCTSLSAFSQQAATVFGQALVQLEKDANPHQLETMVNDQIGILPTFKVESCVSEYMHIWLFSFDENEIPKSEMLRLLNAAPMVIVAQANHIVAERIVPNDPFFGQQWHHVQTGDHDIDTDLAWDITTGGLTALGDEIVVCVVEGGGANWAVADIAANHWTNTNEIAGNNIDDDDNGYIDDVDGWNASALNDNLATGNHGTQVSSMIGSKGDNNTGVTGVNWNVKIMQVQMGGISEANVIAAYMYPMLMRKLYNETAGQQGAFVVATNSSWGTDGGQPEDAPLWCAMYDSLGTYGILSCGATANNNVNIDVVGDLPTACPSPFMVSVTATNNADVRTFSGYGQTQIDLGAPGENVYMANNNSYGAASGTSFASPCVAGGIALLYSAPCTSFMQVVQASPEDGAIMAREFIYDGVDPVSNLTTECVTGGRMNIFNSISLMVNNCAGGACAAPFSVSSNQIQGTLNYVIAWTAIPTAEVFLLQYRIQGSPDWIIIDGIMEMTITLNDLEACSTYEYQLASLCGEENSDWGNIFTFETDGCCVNPDTYLVLNSTENSATIQWNNIMAANFYTLSFGPAGGPYTDINDITTNQYTFSDLLLCTSYEVSATSICKAGNPNTVIMEFTTQGCEDCSEFNNCTITGNSALEHIANVTLGDINYDSGADGGYLQVVGETTTLNSNGTYTIYCTPGFGGNNYDEYFIVWIDYNANGIFEDATEIVFDSGGGSPDQVSGSFTVPLGVPNTVVTMRVAMIYDDLFSTDVPVACGALSYGEVEDYCITLDATINVNEQATQPLMLYPNPALDHITIMDNQAMRAEKVVVRIMDATGRVVLQQNVANGSVLDVSSLPAGIYSVIVQGKHQSVQKFVKK